MIKSLTLVFLKAAGLVVLYVAAARLGLRLEKVQENARVLWPQAGIALGGLLVLGLRYWPAVATGSLVVTLSASIVSQQSTPFTLAMSVGFAAGNTVGALAAAWGLRHLADFSNAVGRVRDVYAFLLFGIVVGPLASASIVVPTYVLAEPAAASVWVELFARRLFGHALSNMVLAPVILAWTRPFRSRWPVARVGEGVLLVELVVLLCMTGFSNRPPAANLNLPVLFAPFPFVIWAALRFAQRGAVTVTLMVAGISIYGTTKGFGPFAVHAQPHALLLLQLYLATIALCGMALSASVAERHATAEKLTVSRERLRALSARLQAAREEERALISREIHDELGQQLTGVKMALHALLKKLPESNTVIAEKSAFLSSLVDESVQTIRRIASDLRPGILDDLGLVPSMQWLVDEFRKQSGLHLTFRCDCEEVEVGRGAATALFRILQESLTNIARHANATSVDVSLVDGDGELVLTVRDNGCGIPPDVFTGSKHLGLLGMRERAELLGGKLSITGEDLSQGAERRSGTVVCARIPLSAELLRGAELL